MTNSTKGKILVTGGAGYIGSHTIIELLQNTSSEVISADSFINASPKTFDRIEAITGKRIKNYNVDLTNSADTKKIFEENKDIIGIIHFAALKSVGESVDNPLLYYHNNLVSLLNILSCITNFGIKNFIFSSSCSVYGNIDVLPVTEATVLQKAESPYANTKQIGEQILESFSKSNPSVFSIALRYFNPVGAHVSGMIGEVPIKPPNNLVPIITQTAIGKMNKTVVFGTDYNTRDGSCIRDYVHVSDIADAHVKALNYLIQHTHTNNYVVFNLGTGKGVSVLEAIHSFEKVSGLKLNYEIGQRRSGDVVAIYSDIEKSSKILGWTPKYNLDDMMRTAWMWEQNLKNNK